jgi:hypothetical protein
MQSFTLVLNAWRTAFALRKVVLWFWFANFFISLLVGAPLWELSHRRLASSSVAADMTHAMDPAFFTDAMGQVISSSIRVSNNLIVGGILLLLWQVLAVAGLFSAVHAYLQDGVRPTFSRFVEASGSGVGRFTRLSLWGLLLLTVVGITKGAGEKGIDSYARKVLTEIPVDLLSLVLFLTVLMLFVVTRAMLDLARAELVQVQQPVTRRALWAGVRQVMGSPLRCAGVYALTGLIGWGAFLVLGYLRMYFPEASMGTSATLIVVGQLAVLMRMGAMVAVSAAAYELRRSG